MGEKVIVRMVVDGQEWTAFETVSVSYGARQAARSFSATVSDDTKGFMDRWDYLPGSKVQVYGNGDLLLTGHIDAIKPKFDSESHSVEVTARSKGGDSVDSSQTHQTGRFENKNIHQIAQELDRQGVGFTLGQGVQLRTIPYFQANPAETVYQAVERLARRDGLLLSGQADGSIRIERGGDQRGNAPLIEGVNILSGSADIDMGKRRSEYRVRGQRRNGQNQNELRIDRASIDRQASTGGRYRPLVILPEFDIDDGQAQRRARWHRDRAKGLSVRGEISVQGWHDDGGQLWQTNKLVYVYCPSLKLDQDMLIDKVELSQGRDGSTASLSLVGPKSFGSPRGGGSRSGGTGGSTGGSDAVWQDDDSSEGEE